MRALVLAILLSLGASTAMADCEVIPASYLGTAGEMGWYPWYDETGSQLTDGVYGGPSPNEPGFPGRTSYDWYPWVGWDSHPTTTTFVFAAPVTLTSWVVSTQRDLMPSIYIPSRVDMSVNDVAGNVVYSNSWYYEDPQFDDGYRHALSQSLPRVEGKSVTLTLHPTQRWILVAEVDFYAVPEPATLIELLTGIGVLLVRRRR